MWILPRNLHAVWLFSTIYGSLRYGELRWIPLSWCPCFKQSQQTHLWPSCPSLYHFLHWHFGALGINLSTGRNQRNGSCGSFSLCPRVHNNVANIFPRSTVLPSLFGSSLTFPGSQIRSVAKRWWRYAGQSAGVPGWRLLRWKFEFDWLTTLQALTDIIHQGDYLKPSCCEKIASFLSESGLRAFSITEVISHAFLSIAGE